MSVSRTTRASWRCLISILFLLYDGTTTTFAFLTPITKHKYNNNNNKIPSSSNSPLCTTETATSLQRSTSQQSTTSLNALLDVPDGFFTITFPMLGILLSLSKYFGRIRMEQLAWEQRLQMSSSSEDNTSYMTELDVRRQQAAKDWSAYGAPRMEQEQLRQQSRRTATMEPPISGKMSMSEMEQFEAQYGIPYDPYYDDPYELEELPTGNYKVDRLYGDRIYDDGEIFYKDAATGLYYRQGAKPRSGSGERWLGLGI